MQSKKKKDQDEDGNKEDHGTLVTTNDASNSKEEDNAMVVHESDTMAEGGLPLGPWGEELPSGAWGASRSGSAQQNLWNSMTNTTKRNLNDDVRISRLQRMVHMLFRVGGASPARIDERNKAKNKKQMIENQQVTKVNGMKKCPKPEWHVKEPLPLCHRINLRFLAAWWNLIALVLCLFVARWYYYTSANSNDEEGVVAAWEYRDPTRL